MMNTLMTKKIEHDFAYVDYIITEHTNVVHAKGNSMLPKIKDGDLCIFEYKQGTADEGDIVLMECNQYDIEYGGRYTIKKFSSQRRYTGELWPETTITLKPLNTAEYQPIILTQSDEQNYKVVGVLKGII